MTLTKTEARVAILECEKTCRHLKLGERYRVDGKAYKREVRKADKRFNSMIRTTIRKGERVG